MSIKIIAIGQKMPAWIEAGFLEYHKRLSSDWWRTTLIELPLAPRSKNSHKAQLVAKEAESLSAALRPNETLIALDERGLCFTTQTLANQLKSFANTGQPISFVIGGPDGLAPSITQQATALWSLSSLTLPHPLVRVLLIEQLYRAYSLLHHHPYHRE